MRHRTGGGFLLLTLHSLSVPTYCFNIIENCSYQICTSYQETSMALNKTHARYYYHRFCCCHIVADVFVAANFCLVWSYSRQQQGGQATGQTGLWGVKSVGLIVETFIPVA